MAELSRDDYKYVLAQLKSAGLDEAQAKAQMAKEGYSYTESVEPYDNFGIGDLAGDAWDMTKRALDYTSGLGRGAVYGGIQELADTDLGVRLGEVLKGNAPGSGEMIKKLAPHADPGAAEALGFASDVFLDPAMYLSLGAGALAKGAPKAAMALSKADQLLNMGNMLGGTVENAGKNLHASGFKAMDSKLIEKGMEPVSPHMFKRGVWGSQDSILSQMDDIGEELAGKRAALYDEATQGGARINPATAFEDAEIFLKHKAAQDAALAPRIAPLLEQNKVYYKPDAKALKGAQSKYDAEVAQFLKDAKAYRKDAAAYRRAGGTPDQFIFPFSDVGQTTGKANVSVPLQTEGNMMHSVNVSPHDPQQMLLPDLPMAPNPSPFNGMDQALLPTAQRMELDKVSKDLDMYALSKGEQGEILGTDLVPQQYGNVDMPFTDFAGPDQLSMHVVPPTRPKAPKMDEVPLELWDFQRASDIKSNMYNTLPATAYDANNIKTDWANTYNKKRAHGIKSQIVEEGNKVRPGLGDEVDKINEEWGSVINAKPHLSREMSKEMRKDLFTQTKMGIGTANGPSALAMFAAQAMNATPFRTGVGLGVNKIGQSAPEALWRQLLLAPTDKGD